jgi:hypothetical protein
MSYDRQEPTMAVIKGTDNPDTFPGTSADDTLSGFSSDDRLCGCATRYVSWVPP